MENQKNRPGISGSWAVSSVGRAADSYSAATGSESRFIQSFRGRAQSAAATERHRMTLSAHGVPLERQPQVSLRLLSISKVPFHYPVIGFAP